jgi:hypothetical protein
MVQPQYNADAWFYSEQGQKDWVEAMELDTLTPDLPQLLIEMGIKYDPDKLAAQLSSRWPQVRARAGGVHSRVCVHPRVTCPPTEAADHRCTQILHPHLTREHMQAAPEVVF